MTNDKDDRLTDWDEKVLREMYSTRLLAREVAREQLSVAFPNDEHDDHQNG